ncbi:MAG TPA: cell division protein FtsQ/DivIB [Chloroflexota bacterium]|nr:cell division protein FtsQ/DivIB [Chloroflexota bacterium]
MSRPPGNRDAEESAKGRMRSLLVPAALLILSLILLGACAGGLFRVRHVEVLGAGPDAGSVAAVAGVGGQNIFDVESDAVVRRVATIPSIAIRRVATNFPGQVVIYAQVRKAAIAWRDGKTLYRISPTGIVMNPIPRTSLPILTGPAPGSIPEGVVAAVAYAARKLPALPDGAIALFHIRKTGALHIVGRAGWNANLGQGGTQKLVDRVATLAAYLRTLPGKQIPTTIDMRFPDPVARYGP